MLGYETRWRFTEFFHSQTAKIGSLVDIQDSEDPEGLRIFYYLVQDLRVSNNQTPLTIWVH